MTISAVNGPAIGFSWRLASRNRLLASLNLWHGGEVDLGRPVDAQRRRQVERYFGHSIPTVRFTLFGTARSEPKKLMI